MPKPTKARPRPVHIVVEIMVEEARQTGWLDPSKRRPDEGCFFVRPLVAHRLTRTMANMVATRLKTQLMRAGFTPLKTIRALRT